MSCLFLCKIAWHQIEYFCWLLRHLSWDNRHLHQVSQMLLCHGSSLLRGKVGCSGSGRVRGERRSRDATYGKTGDSGLPITQHCTVFSSSLWARQWQTSVRISTRNISTSKYFVMKGNYFYNRLCTQVDECWDSVEVENMWECLSVRIIALQYRIWYLILSGSSKVNWTKRANGLR